MWARVVEIMLGCWLAASPFIFRHAAEDIVLWYSDLFSAFAVIALACASFWTPLRHAHLGIALVGLWLVCFGYLTAQHPSPPALQNDLLVGLLLMMFAIIPNETLLPTRSWREFYALMETGKHHEKIDQSATKYK